MKLQHKIWLATVTVFALIMAGDYLIGRRMIEASVRLELERDARDVRAMLMATRRVYHQQFLNSGLPLNDKTIGFLPAHALSRISADFPNWSKSGLYFNNVSDTPRNPANQADAVELDAIAYFRANPKATERTIDITDGKGESMLHYTAPVWTEAYCLKCHGERSQAPTTIANTYDTAYSYQMGDLRGVMSIKVPSGSLREQEIGGWQQRFSMRLAGYVALLLLLGSLMQRLVSRRVARIEAAATQIAAGDYSARIATNGNMGGKDELTRLGLAFDGMAATLQQREQSLREAEEKYRTFADYTYDWEVWVDPDGHYRYISPSCQRITGYAAAEFAADPSLMRRIVHPDDQAVMTVHFETIRSPTDGNCTTTFRIITKAGEPRWIEHICHPVLRADGTYLGRRASNRDITERKQAEEKINVLNAALENRVDERTAQLEATNSELIRARDAAEAANRAKSVFLSNMSHELRTPLNAILGFAQIMERDKAIPPHEQRNLQTINRSGRHLLSLINDVLEIARIEAGRTTVQNEAFDLNATLAAVDEMIRVRADAKGLAFAIERHGELPGFVLGDAHHLRQVLINLLGNAVKYTDHGQVGLHIHAATEKGIHSEGIDGKEIDGDRIRFDVTDSGPGIGAEDMEHIFSAFFQTAGGIAKGEGTGLGLNISRGFVRLMGGELTVASEPGKGSTFSFAVPLPPTFPPPGAIRSGRVLGIAAGQAPCRVLIAEDHPDNRELIVSLLESVGFQVRATRNGREAVAAFKDWHPHFIWMDMRMPVMDGYEASRAIRALPGGNAVRIAALTATAFNEDRAAIIAAGCDEMVRKPIEESRLFEVMGQLLNLRFRYEEDGNPADSSADDDSVSLAALPANLRAELADAARSLDKQATLAIVERLRPGFPAEASAIARLVDAYRFDRLLELCQN